MPTVISPACVVATARTTPTKFMNGPSRIRTASPTRNSSEAITSPPLSRRTFHFAVRRTKGSAAPLGGARCSALFNVVDGCLHSFDERLKLALPVRLGSPPPPVNGTVLEWVSNLPGVEMHVHMRNSVAVYLVVDFDRSGHLLERQRGNLDVAHE